MTKVLIVDDALTDRVRAAGIVSNWLQDCTILEAENGRVALEQIEVHLPDLVLTDLHMPELNGLELVAAVKEDYPNIPVVLMTAKGSEEIASRALRDGAASYVPKARLAEDLIGTLNQVYGASQVSTTQSRVMHYLSNLTADLELPNDLSLIEGCVDQILNMLRCLPLADEAERLRVGIALQEALNNACFHGNLQVRDADPENPSAYLSIAEARAWVEPYVHRKIHIHIEISRSQAKFVIRDEGEGFTTNASSSAEMSNGTGRGITLMNSIMDEVQFNSAGNEVTMLIRAVSDNDLG